MEMGFYDFGGPTATNNEDLIYTCGGDAGLWVLRSMQMTSPNQPHR